MYCLIINNDEFLSEKLRTGSQNDCKLLRRLFEELLHYDFTIENNLTEEQMKNKLKEFVIKCDNAGDDCDGVILVIMTHGSADDVITTDEKALKVNNNSQQFLKNL